MHLGVVVSRVALARPGHTTVLLCAAAVAAGHEVSVFETGDFSLNADGRAMGRARALRGCDGVDDVVARLQTTPQGPPAPLGALDRLLLRANPFQDAVVTFGMFAQAEGVDVRNDPRTLLRTSHKGYLPTLVDVPQPRTLVCSSSADALAFATTSPSGVVVKPSRSGGGRGVVRVPAGAPDTELVEAVGSAGRDSFDGYVIVQEYLPEAEAGEKRVLWVDGRVAGGYLRMRPPGDFRHNLRLGGHPLPCDLRPDDLAVAAALGPHLRAAGVWFAGIDVIGGRAVEVNTLNPGGVHHTSVFSGANVADELITSLFSP